MAVQEQATRTNAINAKLDKTQAESECRFCDRVDETVRLSCECPMLAQKGAHKRRHDWVGREILWEVCKKTGFDVNEN